MEPVILHIGAGKTGTSSLQSFLSLNRERLPFAYPPLWADKRAAKGRETTGNFGELTRGILNDGDLAGAVRALQPGGLFSSERLWDVPRLYMRELLAAVPARVVIYLRPQVAMLAAGYRQLYRRGGVEAPPFERYWAHARRGLLYSLKLEDVAGAREVIVRKYDRAALVGGDIVDDFFAALGLATPEGCVRPAPVNVTTEPFPFDAETARRITDWFRADNDRLARLLGRDLGLTADNERAAAELEEEGD